MLRPVGETCSANADEEVGLGGAHTGSIEMTDERLRAEDSIEEITWKLHEERLVGLARMRCERGALGGDELVAVNPGRDQFVRRTELLLASGFRIAIAIVEARGPKQRCELAPRRARNDGEVELVGNARDLGCVKCDPVRLDVVG